MTKSLQPNTQEEERNEVLKNILDAKEKKKIIVAGAGTGKTHTFKAILAANSRPKNLSLTFIRILADDMKASFSDLSETKTLHAYCRGVIPKIKRKVHIVPSLTKIIEKDASFFGIKSYQFDEDFQLLKESSRGLKFYLARGDYYQAVGFNDLVYRVYRAMKDKPDTIADFNQILIDEFQDFNKLEVEFINELEKRGSILIVGDDDQAVYDKRSASPDYLRQKYNSGLYKTFTLPFCSRCTQVVVDATNSFIKNAVLNGYLKDRLTKRFECYIEGKKEDNERFPHIIHASVADTSAISEYIKGVIKKADKSDISHSWKKGSEYPTVLVIGPRDYLSAIAENLRKKYPQTIYKVSVESPFTIAEAYEALLKNRKSNIGWRILIHLYMRDANVKRIINQTKKRKQLLTLLPANFVKKHNRVLDVIKTLKKKEPVSLKTKREIKKIATNNSRAIIDFLVNRNKRSASNSTPDTSKPSILLSTFAGCKGLSAAYVLIVGANEGDMPQDKTRIRDVEISRFIVAMTRTRKQCHIISNKSFRKSKNKKVAKTKSIFLDWISSHLIESR